MADPTLAQMYNGIYSAYDPSIPPIPPQQPIVASPAPVQQPSATPSIQQMYENIYGPATYEWAAQRTAPAPAAAPRVQTAGPATPAVNSPINWGEFMDIFPSTANTRVENANAYMDVGIGPNSYAKDTERLLPNPMGSAFPSNIGQPPTTRVVQSTRVTPAMSVAAASVPLPRPRPEQSSLGAMFALPTPIEMRPPPPPAVNPLRVAVQGANSYSGGGGSSSSSPSAPASFSGSSTGNQYNVGQQYVMNGQTYTANASGGFTNDSTGRDVAVGSGWKALHGHI